MTWDQTPASRRMLCAVLALAALPTGLLVDIGAVSSISALQTSF